MRIILLVAIMFPIISYGQGKVDRQIGDLIVGIPKEYSETDTLGQQLVTAQIEDGFIIISKTSNSDISALNISDNDQLLEFYSGFQRGVIKSSEGELISEELIFQEDLKFRKFSYRAKVAEETQIRTCLSLMLNDNTYAIQFWQPESVVDQKKEERERFFNSIKLIPNLSVKSQFSQNVELESPSFKLGYMIGQGLAYLILLSVLALLVRWVIKRSKKNTVDA